MEDLVLGVRRVPLVLRSLGGLEFACEMFLHHVGHHGSERLLERLDDHEIFLPLVLENGHVALHSKTAIAALRCLEVPADWVELLELGADRVEAIVRLHDGLELRGRVGILLPGTRRRLLDLLNAPGRFFLMETNQGVWAVNRSFVLYVLPI